MDRTLVATTWVEPQSSETLAGTCIQAYLDHVYFDLPVLDIAHIFAAVRSTGAPFDPGSLRHHALIASAMPWLSSAFLEKQGIPTRQAGLEAVIADFEAERQRSTDTDPVIAIQALLLIIHAARQLKTRELHLKCSKWLREAIRMLAALFRGKGRATSENLDAQAQRRLYKRLWWCTFITEQAHYLKSTLEIERAPKLPISFALNLRQAEPMFARDLDFTVQNCPGYVIPGYWTRLQRAMSFIQRSKLWAQLATLLSQAPESLHHPNRQPAVSSGYLSHCNLFWRMHDLGDSIQLLPDMSQEDPDAEDDPETEGLYLQQAETVMTYCQIMVMLSRLKIQTVSREEACIWAVLHQERLTQVIQAMLRSGRRFTLGDSSGARTFTSNTFFQTLMATAKLLIIPSRTEATELHMHFTARTKTEVRSLLSLALAANKVHWLRPTSTCLSSRCANTPMLIDDAEDVSSPESPQDDRLPDIHELLGFPAPSIPKILTIEHEQQSLLENFEDMWNSPITVLRDLGTGVAVIEHFK